MPGIREHLREVEIVGEDHIGALAGVGTYVAVRGLRIAQLRPVNGLVSGFVQASFRY
jgi:hypothetical protein